MLFIGQQPVWHSESNFNGFNFEKPKGVTPVVCFFYICLGTWYALCKWGFCNQHWHCGPWDASNFFSPFRPQFSLCGKDNDRTYLIEMLWGLKGLMKEKCLEQSWYIIITQYVLLIITLQYWEDRVLKKKLHFPFWETILIIDFSPGRKVSCIVREAALQPRPKPLARGFHRRGCLRLFPLSHWDLSVTAGQAYLPCQTGKIQFDSSCKIPYAE